MANRDLTCDGLRKVETAPKETEKSMKHQASMATAEDSCPGEHETFHHPMPGDHREDSWHPQAPEFSSRKMGAAASLPRVCQDFHLELGTSKVWSPEMDPREGTGSFMGRAGTPHMVSSRAWLQGRLFCRERAQVRDTTAF